METGIVDSVVQRAVTSGQRLGLEASRQWPAASEAPARAKKHALPYHIHCDGKG